ncbi:TetR/AcrR family transcriptional regulator [Embleya scabrispora]|uniref:TetR/AcrR family transcriptional regulator n=1 Tax=Embleya scabrispora TaxID=159449 RepID=UPI00037CAA69|nr:TetR/AcrR family transcriptional regulator [Embleya scabrispora]MYS81281.1 TetR family transcriptional regulator [Streptomyces sp. SID5474]
MASEQAAGTSGRRGYHHGDLRNALTEAAVERARAGGPQAIVLRETARASGVSSTAAYRHFANHHELVVAVKDRGLAMLAATMRAELAAGEPCPDPGDEALRRLRAAGLGYVRFAFAEPGLFRTIFHGVTEGDPMIGRRQAAAAAGDGEGHLPGTPDESEESYTLMSQALDELVVLGRLPAERRKYSDVVMWSAVHGLSVLLLDTELAHLPDEIKADIVRRGIDVALNGL